MPRAKRRGGRSARGKVRKNVPEPSTSGGSAFSSNFNSTCFGGDGALFCGSDLEVFGEVTVSAEDDIQDINVENSRSNSPSINDCYSNENSLSSLATTESNPTKLWTREEDLTPSAVLPDNLFTDEEIKSFNLDQLADSNSLNMNDDLGFNINNLFEGKEELLETTQPKSIEGSTDDATKKIRRRVKVEANQVSLKEIRPMAPYEEQLLYRRLHQLAEKNELNGEQRRLYRKLSLRNRKASLGMQLFNLDHLVATLTGQEWPFSKDTNNCQFDGSHVKTMGMVNVLDRFQKAQIRASDLSSKRNLSFRMRLVGCEDHIPQPFVSPYTGRTLKPFIRRDYESKPLKLKLMEEIRSRRREKESVANLSRPIDYCYVQPHHISAVSAMCREFFWSGIDLTECLEYPDFSCVVLYGHLIVGFAFMVPDVSYNEAYISYIFTHPEWRGAGIATFMLYHLIQSCMGKDVTLHVSATNPALNLYHKFGFKVEEFVQDFYDKYLPADSTQCKHAFFMRLTR